MYFLGREYGIIEAEQNLDIESKRLSIDMYLIYYAHGTLQINYFI